MLKWLAIQQTIINTVDDCNYLISLGKFFTLRNKVCLPSRTHEKQMEKVQSEKANNFGCDLVLGNTSINPINLNHDICDWLQLH